MLWLAIALVTIGTLADWYTTKEGLKLGLGEKNPISRVVMRWASRVGYGIQGQVFFAALVVDGLVVPAFYFLLRSLRGPAEMRVEVAWLFLAGAANLLVSGHNLRAIRRVRARQRRAS